MSDTTATAGAQAPAFTSDGQPRPNTPITVDVGGIAGKQLQAFIERIERLVEEKKALMEDIKEVFAEAKGNGFDVKTMRAVLKIRNMDKDDLDEQEALLDTYLRALGMKLD